MTDYRALMAAVRGRWWLVAASVAVGILAALAGVALTPVEYTSTARVFIATPAWNDSTGSAQPDSVSTSSSYGDQFTQQRMSSYLEVLTSPAVLARVARKSGVAQADLESDVSGRLVPDTVIMEIHVNAPSAVQSADIANLTATAFSDAVENIEKPSTQAESPVQPVVLTPAVAASEPSAPDGALYLVIGATVGVLIGLGAAAGLGRSGRSAGLGRLRRTSTFGRLRRTTPATASFEHEEERV